MNNATAHHFRITDIPAIRVIAACLVLIALSVPASGQDEDDIQELEVTGYRRLADLQRQIDEAEDHMYAIFNELNDDDLYDIHCRREAELGTRISRKVCRPVFLERAEKQNGLDFLHTAQGSAYASSATPTNAVIGHEMPNLEDKMKEAARTHPAFADALMALYELQEQYRLRVSGSAEED